MLDINKELIDKFNREVNIVDQRDLMRMRLDEKYGANEKLRILLSSDEARRAFNNVKPKNKQ